jgi:hypothetical protein
LSSGLGIAEKRTAIEVRIAVENMVSMDARWQWVNTHQQLADGLTKVGSRQTFADQLRRGMHAFRHDPSFVAGKKLTTKQRNEHEQALDDAAAEWNEANVVQDDGQEDYTQTVLRKAVNKATRYGLQSPAARIAKAVALAASAKPSAAYELVPSHFDFTPSVVYRYIVPGYSDAVIISALLTFCVLIVSTAYLLSYRRQRKVKVLVNAEAQTEGWGAARREVRTYVRPPVQVFTTPTGERFHLDGSCRCFFRGGQRVSRATAYGPCRLCAVGYFEDDDQ